MVNETKLLQQARNGDTSAFAEIVDKYQSLVCAITFSGTGRVEVSEELAQETFLSAWKNLGQLEKLDRFQSWLCTIARNMLNSYYRKKQTVSLESADINQLSDNKPGPSESLISEEEAVMLEKALMKIPAEYREPLVMYYRQGKSVNEVAAVLEINPSTVQSRLFRARKMLREEVAERCERSLEKSGPGKAFKTAVMASVCGAAMKGAATASAAGAAGEMAAASSGVTGAAATGGAAGVMGAVGVKIAAVAAAAVIAVGGVFIYKNNIKSQRVSEPDRQVSMTVNQDKEDLSDGAGLVSAGFSVNMTEGATPEAIVKTIDTNTGNEELTKPVLLTVDIDSEEDDNSDYVFEPKGVLSGVVTDAKTGKPIKDAELSTRSGLTMRVKTDENGFYSLDKIERAGDYSIGVHSDDYVGIFDESGMPKIHLEQDSKAVQHFQLQKACVVDVIVTDEDGVAIEDASVLVSSLANEHGVRVGKPYGQYSTDENGYVLIGGLAPSDKPYVFTAMHTTDGGLVEKHGHKIWTEVPDYAPGYVRLTLTDPNVIELGRIVLNEGVTVQGTAKYLDGTPAKECEIRAYPDWWHNNTVPPQYQIEPNGLFTMTHVAEGNCRIQAVVPLGQGASLGITLLSTKFPLADRKLLDLTINQKTGGNRFFDDRIVTTADTEQKKIRGTVVDAATNRTIPNFKVRYGQVGLMYYSSEGKWTQYNNPDGNFSVDIVGGKDVVCRVQVVADGYAEQWSDEIDTSKNEPLLFRLTRGGEIAGTVVDEQGEPVKGAKVVAYSLARGVRKFNVNEPIFENNEGAVLTDEQGRFAMSNVSAGEETLQITHDDYVRKLVGNVAVREDQGSDIGKIVLNNGGIVEGFLYDGKGEPVSGAMLNVQNHFMYSTSEVRYGSVITDPNGYYRFENLPEERCFIVRPNSYKYTGVVSRGLVPVNNKVVNVDMAGKVKIKGRLIVNGESLENTRVILHRGLNNTSGLYRYQADTNEDGSFELRAGLPGSYTVSYEYKSANSVSATIKLADVNVGSEDIDLSIVPSNDKTLKAWVKLPDMNETFTFSLFEANDSAGSSYLVYRGGIGQAEMPIEVSLPGAGAYRAVVYYKGNNVNYLFPIEVTNEKDVWEERLEVELGSVTLMGKLPEKVNHVYLASEDRSTSAILINKKDDGFVMQGIKPGKYYLNPKHQRFDDSIEVTVPDTAESVIEFNYEQLLSKLKERVFVKVFGDDGFACEDANVWIESERGMIMPASSDGFSSVFYLGDGDYVIHAEKNGAQGSRLYRMKVDVNNSAGGEAFETFVRIR